MVYKMEEKVKINLENIAQEQHEIKVALREKETPFRVMEFFQEYVIKDSTKISRTENQDIRYIIGQKIKKDFF